MRLKQEELINTELWEDNGYELPRFDRIRMIQRTKENPEWLHFGAGNLFRAFPAEVCQELLNKGLLEKGIIAVEGYDYEIIDKCYKRYDNLSMLVTLKTDGKLEKKVIGSIAEALCADPNNKEDWERLKSIFQNPSLRMVTFTITEKGYRLTDHNNEFLPAVLEDFRKGPFDCISYIGKIAALCYERFRKGKNPLTMVSMDNCSHNGTRLYEAVIAYAENWSRNRLVEPDFPAYMENSIAYPWTMIDKITPRPSGTVADHLTLTGLKDTEIIVTSRNTFTASFVNAEEPQYLVIEDHFLNGRLPLEQAGIIYTDRETVDKTEKMKVCTCLNPLHTALAVFGCLLGYKTIHEEMTDPLLVKMVECLGYQEGLPVVINPKIIDPKKFIDEVIQVRLPNPFLEDTPQRIATDTSQKLAIRFGETVKTYLSEEKRSIENLMIIPLVYAGWFRYLLGIDDYGTSYNISSDPLLNQLKLHFEGICLGEKFDEEEILRPLLSNQSIFGVDLYQAGLSERVKKYFVELTRGTGAVRTTLEEYLRNDHNDTK
jgi:Mannitol-1-phosphate/altronate dehydrogenases